MDTSQFFDVPDVRCIQIRLHPSYRRSPHPSTFQAMYSPVVERGRRVIPTGVLLTASWIPAARSRRSHT